MVIEDSGYPVQSSTGTLTIRVCGCNSDGSLLTCSPEAIFLPVGLSTGALIAILLCIVILLGECTAGCDQIRIKTNLMGSMRNILMRHCVGVQHNFIHGECDSIRLLNPRLFGGNIVKHTTFKKNG